MRKPHQFDPVREVCICCLMTRVQIEDQEAHECRAPSPPTRDWLLNGATTQVRLPTMMSPK